MTTITRDPIDVARDEALGALQGVVRALEWALDRFDELLQQAKTTPACPRGTVILRSSDVGLTDVQTERMPTIALTDAEAERIRELDGEGSLTPQ